MALKTETNTPKMERRIRAAFRSWSWARRRVNLDFEHGQWWVTDRNTGAQWSVCDASGPNTVDGFDFEQVTVDDED